MSAFRKRPIEIEALQIPAAPWLWLRDRDLPEWLLVAACLQTVSLEADRVIVVTLEGDMTGWPGDWLIRGVEGELYPCKASIFAATYEPVGGAAITAALGDGAIVVDKGRLREAYTWVQHGERETAEPCPDCERQSDRWWARLTAPEVQG